jgi:hypothetical protein
MLCGAEHRTSLTNMNFKWKWDSDQLDTFSHRKSLPLYNLDNDLAGLHETAFSHFYGVEFSNGEVKFVDHAEKSVISIPNIASQPPNIFFLKKNIYRTSLLNICSYI